MKPGFLLLTALCLMLFFFPARAESAVDVTSIQQRLLSLGYEIGKADGIFGTKTSSALLLAQTLLSDAGYEVSPTGRPDADTVSLIMKDENQELLRTLLKGSWGSRVREAQEKLIRLNLLHDSADGKYGTNTETAVPMAKKIDSMMSLGWDVNDTAETAPLPSPEIILVSMVPMTTAMMLSMTAGMPMMAIFLSFADVLVCWMDASIGLYLSRLLVCWRSSLTYCIISSFVISITLGVLPSESWATLS